MKKQVLSVLAILMAGGTAGCVSSQAPVMPEVPVVVRTPLPVSDTAVGTMLRMDTGYGDRMAGYVQGVLADMRGDSQRASASYVSALAEDPDNLGLRGRVFEVSLLAGDVDTALRIARTLPSGAGNKGNTMLALVRALGDTRDGRLKEAQQQLKQATQVAPELLQFKLLGSYLAVARGQKVADEVAYLRDLPGPQPLQARKLYHIARMWLKVGNTEAARAALEESNKLEPGALFTTLLLANMYERSGEPDKALALYKLFEEKNPQVALLDGEVERVARGVVPPAFASTLDEDIGVTLFDFGLMVWAQGAAVPARELMNLALWMDPQDPYLLYYAGIVDEFAGDADSARAKYARIAEDSPVWLAGQIREAEARYRLAETHDDAAGKADAMDSIRQLLRGREESVPLHRTLAEMAFDAKDYKLAVREYTALLESGAFEEQYRVMAVLYFARGASYERMKEYDLAAADLQRSLSLDPNRASVLNYLGYMWVEQGVNLEAATKILEKALLLAPGDGAITDSLGWAYYVQGDVEKALPFLERATDLTPDDAAVNEHLGDAYWKLGRKDEARRQWTRALDLAGEDNDLRKRVEDKFEQID